MFKKHDWYIFGFITVIVIIGLLTLLSTTIGNNGGVNFSEIIIKQLLFVGLGYILYFITSLFSYHNFKYIQVCAILFSVTVILLILTLLFGPVINSAQRWLLIGGTQIQPSEIAKITVIFTTACIVGNDKIRNDVLKILISFIPTIIIVVLVFVQPHGSMALIILTLWALTAFAAMGNKTRNLSLAAIFLSFFMGILLVLNFQLIIGFVFFFIGIVTFVYLYYKQNMYKSFGIYALLIGFCLGLLLNFTWRPIWGALPEHQQTRINDYIEMIGTNDVVSFNVDQSIVAIGSGGFWGKGFGYGTQGRLSFLPEYRTDFIFAVFAEQFGLIGVIVLFSLYASLLFRIFKKSMGTDDNFASIVLIILGIKILMEIFINIGTNTGIIPATGIPLPFISAGGTITIMTFITFGIIQSIISNSEIKFDNTDILI